MKKLLSLFLIFVLLLSLSSVTAFAGPFDRTTITIPGEAAHYSAISYGNGVYVLVGIGAGNTPIIYTSSDLVTWTKRIAPNVSIRSMAYGNGRFLGVEYSGRVISSNDGINWSVVANLGSPIMSISFDGGLFIAKMGTGVLFLSTDGINWNQAVIPNVAKVADFEFLNGKFVLLSSDCKVLVSNDFITWDLKSPSLLPTDSIYTTLSYGNGVYVIGAGYDSATSTNLTDWSLTSHPDGLYGNYLIYGFMNGKFLGTHEEEDEKLSTSTDGVIWEDTEDTIIILDGSITVNGKILNTGGWNAISSYDVYTPPAPPEPPTVTDSSIVINGAAESTILSFTVPTTTSFVIKPNETEANSFIAPDFSIKNTSTAPIKVSIKEFKSAVGSAHVFTDVAPLAHTDWNKLNNAQSEGQIAIAIKAKAVGEWQVLTKNSLTYVSEVLSDINLGILNPGATANFSIEAKHGNSFKEVLSTKYQVVFVIELP